VTPVELGKVVHAALTRVVQANGLDSTELPAEVAVERPRNPEHGDYATTVALQCAKKFGTNPRQLGEKLAAELAADPAIAEATVAGPGFVNMRLAAAAQGALVSNILQQGKKFGTGELYAGKKINLEFVSANPTGPIHLGGTRWAAVGDALGRVMEAQGAEVTREYYFNDHGNQIDRFARSLVAAALGEDTPEDGYAGAYINEIASQVVIDDPAVVEMPAEERQEKFRAAGVEMMFDHIKKTLGDFGTHFDVYFHENSLFEKGKVDEAIEILKDSGNLYFEDGAWWLRSSAFGDDKDRVVLKSDGNAAYIAGDIAYVKDKFDRGHDLCIYMLGADHHGYIARLKAAAQAMGYDPDGVEVLIGQMVNLVRDGKAVKMSKRAGTVITLDDLVEAIGVDAARYSMIRSSVDSTLDIDLDLWASQSNDNPVFYVQYAHARLCSLQRKADELGVDTEAADLALLTHEKEGKLIRNLGEFPAVVASAAELREPHRVARYLEDLAGDYHRFYDSCQVLPKADAVDNDTEASLHSARLALCAAARQTLENGLQLLGVTAPERM